MGIGISRDDEDWYTDLQYSEMSEYYKGWLKRQAENPPPGWKESHHYKHYLRVLEAEKLKIA